MTILGAPVLDALLETQALQRLRGVSQAGAVSLVRPERAVTRWDHSVGTMLLVRRLGGGVEEQAAALLHDLGHGAFSHVVDRVFEDDSDSWHERVGLALVWHGEVPDVLARHGLDPERVLRLHDWPLLDRPAPELCADRIDYALRDAVCDGLVADGAAEAFRAALVVCEDTTIAVRDAAQAVWFADRFAALVEDVFCDPVGMWADWALARAVRRALDLGALEVGDLLATDAALLERLRRTRDAEIADVLAALAPGLAVVRDDGRPDVVVRPKARTVDPPVMADGGAIVRASSLEPAIAARAQALRERCAAGIGI